MRRLWVLAAVAGALLGQAAPPDGAQQIAAIGDLQLASGATIRDCRVGYRTFGTLNSARSNAVLVPTWFSGRSEALAALIGPGKLVDSSRYFVIAVDALGDGVLSSPSNSTLQPHMRFPQFTVHDMVASQHRMLASALHLTHLHAVVGVSMGGMQTFEWMVSYPAFLDRAVPVVGSPQLTAYDMLLWRAEAHAIEADAAWQQGEYSQQPAAAMRTVSDIHALNLFTPTYIAGHTGRAEFDAWVAAAEKAPAFDANDWLRQLQAMLAMDIGSFEHAAAKVKAKTLIVVGLQDHMVNPGPALRLAKALAAPTLEIDSACGHMVTACEGPRIAAAVAKFLQ